MRGRLLGGRPRFLKNDMKIQGNKLFSVAAFIGGLCVAAVLLSGCGKKAAPDAPPKIETNANPTQPANALSPVPRGPVPQAMPVTTAIAASASADQAAAQLTIELRKFVLYTRYIPKDFQDFIARHPVKYPPAPAGKVYAIDNGKVVVR